MGCIFNPITKCRFKAKTGRGFWSIKVERGFLHHLIKGLSVTFLTHYCRGARLNKSGQFLQLLWQVFEINSWHKLKVSFGPLLFARQSHLLLHNLYVPLREFLRSHIAQRQRLAITLRGGLASLVRSLTVFSFWRAALTASIVRVIMLIRKFEPQHFKATRVTVTVLFCCGGRWVPLQDRRWVIMLQSYL